MRQPGQPGQEHLVEFPVGDLVFQPALEANSRFPLVFTVIGPVLAKAFLEHSSAGLLSLQELVFSKLSVDQLGRMRERGKRLHGVYSVELKPKKSRHEFLWFEYRRAAVRVMAELCNVLRPEQSIDTSVLRGDEENLNLLWSIAQKIYQGLSQEEVQALMSKIEAMLGVMVEEFQQKEGEGKDIADWYRGGIKEIAEAGRLETMDLGMLTFHASDIALRLMVKKLVEAFPEEIDRIRKEFLGDLA